MYRSASHNIIRSLRAALLAVIAAAWLPAVAQTATEHEVKAAFLYRFLSFIEWPPQALPDAGAPFAIGLLGADELAASLEEAMLDRTAQGRPVIVRRLRNGEPIAGLHLLMVGRSQQDRISQLASEAAQRNIVLVADVGVGLDGGAVIAFLLDEGRVRFEVSLPAAERSGARINSRMLSVAYGVRGEGP